MLKKLFIILMLLVSMVGRAEYRTSQEANRITTPSDLSIRFYPQNNFIYTEEEFFVDFLYVCEDEAFLASRPVVLVLYFSRNNLQEEATIAAWTDPIYLPVSTEEQRGCQLWTKLHDFDENFCDGFYRIQCEDDKTGYVYSVNYFDVKQGKCDESFDVTKFVFAGDPNAGNPDNVEFDITIRNPYLVRDIQEHIAVVYSNATGDFMYMLKNYKVERPVIDWNDFDGQYIVRASGSIEGLSEGDHVEFELMRIEGEYASYYELPSIDVVMAKSSGVEDVMAEPQMVQYYNLNGVRVDNPGSGFYIRRTGNKVEKVHLP